jgi:hypothetical protein
MKVFLVIYTFWSTGYVTTREIPHETLQECQAMKHQREITDRLPYLATQLGYVCRIGERGDTP